MAPSVCWIFSTTVPEESSSATGAKDSGALSPARTAASKVARVPEPALRSMTWILPAVPPTSDQSVMAPVKMPLSCSVVRSSTSTLELTTGPMPTTQTVWSSSLAASAASIFSSAKTSERPIWALPSLTSERPWPDPPPVMAMVTSGYLSSNLCAALSTSVWKEVAPEQLTVPETETVASEAAELPPQPTRPRPAMATVAAPKAPRN